jgi:monothiol glutaredoxin
MEQEITQEMVEAKKEEIKKDTQSNRVVLYMKGNKMAPQCGFSAQVVQVLLNLGVDFETRDILTDEVLRSAIKDFSDWPTLPQLYIDGEFVGGCDIITELYENGELKTLLKI